jgi:hypothetical protein
MKYYAMKIWSGDGNVGIAPSSLILTQNNSKFSASRSDRLIPEERALFIRRIYIKADLDAV